MCQKRDSMDGQVSVFDENGWTARLSEIKAEIPSCGQVYELFAQRFTAAVNAELWAMPEHIAERARTIAELDPDYFTAKDNARDDDDADDETCPHGLDIWTCPAGCGG
jgi:uncharacterized protein YktB (UPF0637 family)